MTKKRPPRLNRIAAAIVALLLIVVPIESPSSQTPPFPEEASPNQGTEANGGNCPPISQSGLDIETVFSEPDKYKSETVEFDGVTLYGDLKKGNVDGNYHLTLGSRKGSPIPAREPEQKPELELELSTWAHIQGQAPLQAGTVDLGWKAVLAREGNCSLPVRSRWEARASLQRKSNVRP